VGRQAKSYMEKGLLVPDEITIRMILERVATPDCARGFILDGFHPLQTFASVALDTMRQLEAQLMMRRYEGFLK